MSKGELIDSHVSLDQCRRAIEALHSHESKKQAELQENELLPGKEPNIWLNVTVKTIPTGHRFKPCKIPVAHPLVDPRTSSICLITKDPQREYKDLLETHGIKFISRVVGVEKLKGKFKPYEARRILLKESGMFLADERIIPILPKLLGTKWFEAKKQPIPVCLTRKDLKGELERAISSTYMNQNQGTCTSVKISTLSHKPAQVLANIKAAVPAVVKNIKGGWDNIQSLHIKTNSSVSLPIWSCTLDDAEGGRWAGLTADSDSDGSEESEGEEERESMVVDEVKMKVDSKSKGKKRTSGNEEDDKAAKPRKKVKATQGSSDTVSSVSVKTSLTDTKAAPKFRKRASAPSEPIAAKADELLVDAPSKSKKAKQAASSGLGSSLGEAKQAEAPLPSEKTSKPNKKSSKIEATTAPERAYSPSAPVVADQPASKEKTGKAKKMKSTETLADAAVTKDELKQKRGAAAGEKKKEKVVRAKGGKSAKDGVLGRKVAQARV